MYKASLKSVDMYKIHGSYIKHVPCIKSRVDLNQHLTGLIPFFSTDAFPESTQLRPAIQSAYRANRGDISQVWGRQTVQT